MRNTSTSFRPNGKRAVSSRAFIGSGNVFADMGCPDAEDALTKARLAYEIGVLIQASKLTQAQAARRLKIDQPKVSALLRGRLAGFSVERLIRFLNDLGQDVEINIRPSSGRHATVVVSSED